MTSTDPTYQNLLATVLACPEEDGPRLVLADYLEEQGDTARAEFVRVQCKLVEMEAWANAQFLVLPESREGQFIAALRQRERELWKVLGDSFDMHGLESRLGSDSGIEREDRICIVKRGFVAEVHTTLTDWMGGPCSCSDGYRIGGGKQSRCLVCHGTGQLPGIGPALVRQQPVEVVRTEKRPFHEDMDHGRVRRNYWMWINNANVVWGLPTEIFDLLSDGFLLNDIMRFPTEQAAQDALSAALLRWAIRPSPAPLTGVV